MLCDDWETWGGGDGLERERCVYTYLTHIVQQKLTQHCKAVKLLFFFKVSLMLIKNSLC